jgi:hypothetical protein
MYRVAAVCWIAATLSACVTGLESSGVVETRGVTAALTTERLVGRWGLASYHDAKDAQRVEAAARGQCANAYVIARGRGATVLMHRPFATQASEMEVKTSTGATLIGPPGGPELSADREVVRWDGRVLVLKWVDTQAAATYGTMVFVRCGPAAA